MKTSAATNKLKRLLEKETELVKNFGPKRARLVMRRIEVLRAAPRLADIPITRPLRRHELTADRKGQFAVCVDEKLRIVFTADEPVPRKDDGGYDLQAITAITIQSIEDYH